MMPTSTITASKKFKLKTGDVVMLDRELEVLIQRTFIPKGVAVGTFEGYDENGDLIVQMIGDYPLLEHRRNIVRVPQ